MPRTWHDRHSANKIEDEEQREFYRKLVADKKPYFMRYIYPSLMKQYNTYIKNTNRNALREFQMTVDELYSLPLGEATERQMEFMKYYEHRMPVGTSDCVMNKICRRFENEFDGYLGRHNSSTTFDYSIMKSGVEYSPKQYREIKRLYDDYNQRLSSYAIFVDYERVDKNESFQALSFMNSDFRKECSKVCPNEEVLCDIILDICYTRNSTKRFAWNMCGKQIIKNLLSKNNNTISFPTIAEDGEIEFGGNRFTVEDMIMEVSE